MTAIISPDNLIEAYGKVIEKDPELVEFLYRVHEKNTVRLRDLAGRFLDIYNALRNFDFVESEDKKDALTKDSRIVFTSSVGAQFWERFGTKVKELYKQQTI